MEKIDHRRNYGIILDTETANTLVENDNRLDMRFVLPYDFGFAVIDTKGNIYEKFSFVNSDIFIQEKDLMQSAYYSKKIPTYEKDLLDGKRILANTYTIRQIIKNLIQKYNCKFIVAHNARFDLTACNNILRWTTKSKYRFFFPYGIQIWDSLKMARQVVANTPTYCRYCRENGYLTKNGRNRLTAEILYRYISGNEDFAESHTGLEDVEIEAQIFAYCMRKKKKMEKNLFHSS